MSDFRTEGNRTYRRIPEQFKDERDFYKVEDVSNAPFYGAIMPRSGWIRDLLLQIDGLVDGPADVEVLIEHVSGGSLTTKTEPLQLGYVKLGDFQVSKGDKLRLSAVGEGTVRGVWISYTIVG